MGGIVSTASLSKFFFFSYPLQNGPVQHNSGVWIKFFLKLVLKCITLNHRTRHQDIYFTVCSSCCCLCKRNSSSALSHLCSFSLQVLGLKCWQSKMDISGSNPRGRGSKYTLGFLHLLCLKLRVLRVFHTTCVITAPFHVAIKSNMCHFASVSLFRLILCYFWTSSESWQLNYGKPTPAGVTQDSSTGTSCL